MGRDDGAAAAGQSPASRLDIDASMTVTSSPARSTSSPFSRAIHPPSDESPRATDATARRQEANRRTARHLLSAMSLPSKIGQMSQVDVSQIIVNNNDGTITPDLDKIRYYFGELGIGSVLNCPNSRGPQWNATQYRSVVLAIRNATDSYDRPPVIWGLDSVHGANYVNGAIMTPQQLNLAASFNVSVAREAGVMASKDTRAAGINWLFSPILGLALDPGWSRVYETFGEDPHLVSVFAEALVGGIQRPDDTGADVIPSRAAACAKHFLGYSMPRTGHDRSPAWIPRRHLYQYFVEPWRRVIIGPKSAKDEGAGEEGGGVLTAMESYSEFDGVPNVANFDSTRDLLRNELSFDGVLVTDYHEIMNLVDWHRVTADGSEAVKLMLRDSSVDMSMVPVDVEAFANQVRAAVNGTSNHPPLPRAIDVGRIDESAERVLTLKARLNMFDEVVSLDSPLIDTVGSDEDREAARDMARQGMILAENREEALPIPTTSQGVKVHVTGPTSNSLSYQSGGWTINWQGSPSESDFTYGTTVVRAAQDVEGWQVTHSCGVSILGDECADDDDASPDAMPSADYVVVCIGEESYTEKPGDIRDLSLAGGQLEYVEKVKALTQKDGGGRVVVVYFGGRPRLLGSVPDMADAVLLAFLPGPDGGRAVIDLISGRVNPSGRLPITYPKYQDGGGAPYFSAVSDRCTYGDGPLPNWDDRRCDVQWSFGHGHSYSSFNYLDLAVSSTEMVFSPPGTTITDQAENKDDEVQVEVSVAVRNSGTIAGSHSVLLFMFDETRHVTPEYKRLRHFDKVALEPGEERSVTWGVTLDDLYHVGPHDDSHRVLQEGMKFRVGLGPRADCRANADDSAVCTPAIELKVHGGGHYVGACDAACRVWMEGGCASHFGMDGASCWNMCTSLASKNYGMHGRHEGWGWNYVECIEAVARGMARDTRDASEESSSSSSPGKDCWKMTAMCRDIFGTDPLDEYGLPPVGGKDVQNSITTGVLTATLAGIAAFCFLYHVCKRGCPGGKRIKKGKKHNGVVEFAPVPNGTHKEKNFTID